jgi:hypothetical protein
MKGALPFILRRADLPPLPKCACLRRVPCIPCRLSVTRILAMYVHMHVTAHGMAAGIGPRSR